MLCYAMRSGQTGCDATDAQGRMQRSIRERERVRQQRKEKDGGRRTEKGRILSPVADDERTRPQAGVCLRCRAVRQAQIIVQKLRCSAFCRCIGVVVFVCLIDKTRVTRCDGAPLFR